MVYVEDLFHGTAFCCWNSWYIQLLPVFLCHGQVLPYNYMENPSSEGSKIFRRNLMDSSIYNWRKFYLPHFCFRSYFCFLSVQFLINFFRLLLNRNSISRSFKRSFADLVADSGTSNSYHFDVDCSKKALTLWVNACFSTHGQVPGELESSFRSRVTLSCAKSGEV